MQKSNQYGGINIFLSFSCPTFVGLCLSLRPSPALWFRPFSWTAVLAIKESFLDMKNAFRTCRP